MAVRIIYHAANAELSVTGVARGGHYDKHARHGRTPDRRPPGRRDASRREARTLPGFADDGALPRHLLSKLARPLRPAPTTKRAA